MGRLRHAGSIVGIDFEQSQRALEVRPSQPWLATASVVWP